MEPKETIHGPDCECGKCTGEDRALEEMEEGICECERMFEPDSTISNKEYADARQFYHSDDEQEA